MNDREMMEQRVDQLRLQLADIEKEQLILNRSKRAVMDELLDTRRQLTRMDRAAAQPKPLNDYFPDL